MTWVIRDERVLGRSSGDLLATVVACIHSVVLICNCASEPGRCTCSADSVIPLWTHHQTSHMHRSDQQPVAACHVESIRRGVLSSIKGCYQHHTIRCIHDTQRVSYRPASLVISLQGCIPPNVGCECGHQVLGLDGNGQMNLSSRLVGTWELSKGSVPRAIAY